MKYGAALGGGGGAGGYQAGVIYRLTQNGWKPDIISCISVGALNGIMLAIGRIQQMKEIWYNLEASMVRERSTVWKYAKKFGLFKLGFGDPPLGYWSNEPLKKLIRHEIMDMTTQAEYYSGAVDIQRGEFINFYIPKGTTFTEENIDRYVDMIVASTAIPLIFTPVTIGDKLLIDGGVVTNTPIKPVSKLLKGDGEKHITIISTKRRSGKPEYRKVKTDLEMAERAISLVLSDSAETDFVEFELKNHMAKHDVPMIGDPDERYTYYESEVFRPMKKLSPATTFNSKLAQADFVHGYMQARDIRIPNA